MTTDAEITQIYYFPVLFGFYTTSIMTIKEIGVIIRYKESKRGRKRP